VVERKVVIDMDSGNEIEEMHLIDILSDPSRYLFYFVDTEISSWVSVALHASGNKYPRNCGIKSGRYMLRVTLNKHVKNSTILGSYFLAAAQYESKCTHTDEDIKNGKIKNCECYALICKLLGNQFEKVDYITNQRSRKKSKKTLIKRLEGDGVLFVYDNES